MKNFSRIDQADHAIEEALTALSRASYLLGFSEGKEIVQRAAAAVTKSRKLLHQHGMTHRVVTRPQVSAEWASSSADGHALADLPLVDELPR